MQYIWELYQEYMHDEVNTFYVLQHPYGLKRLLRLPTLKRCSRAFFCVCLSCFLTSVSSHRPYQNHNILHVLKLLGVEEGGELLSVRRSVPVQVSPLEAPLVAREHLLEAELVGGLVKLVRVSWEARAGASATAECSTVVVALPLVLKCVLTEVVPVRGLLVLLPGDLVVLVEVVIGPHLGHVLVHVTLLHALYPGFQLVHGDVAVAIGVDPVHNFTARHWN